MTIHKDKMRKNIASAAVLVAALLVLALAPLFANATEKKPPMTPAQFRQEQAQEAFSRADARAAAGAAANAQGGTASAAGGAASNDLSIAGDGNSRSWSLFVQPPAFTPPMAPIAGCAPVITQSARSGWVLIGGASVADGKTDPTDCTLIALRNAKVETCQYASAKLIEDLLIAKLLPDYKPGGPQFTDYAPQDCAALKAPPTATAVNYIASVPITKRRKRPAAKSAACLTETVCKAVTK